jgi:hypothetical protein
MQKNAVAQRSAPGDGKKVYFVGPLFNAAERENMTEEEKLKKIFDKDESEVLDIIFTLLASRGPLPFQA